LIGSELTGSELSGENQFRHRLIQYVSIFLLWIAWVFFATNDSHFGNVSQWVAGWQNWDALWYMRIWKEGYGSDLNMLAFPPGYSWLVGATSWSLHLPFAVTATIINLSSLFVGYIVASETLSARFNISRRKIFFLQIVSPTGFYAFSVYSDSVFYCLFWCALALALDQTTQATFQKKLASALLFLFIPWIRITGFTLLIWSLLKRRLSLFVLPSLALWFLINQKIGGSPFQFVKAQSAFAMPPGFFWDGLSYHIHDLLHLPDWASNNGINGWFWLQITVLPLLSLAILLLTSVWFAFNGEWLITVTILAIALFSRNQAFWRSVLRYDWPLMAFVGAALLNATKGNGNGNGNKKMPPGTKTYFILRVGQKIKLKFYNALYYVYVLVAFVIQTAFAYRLHQGQWTF
jgi:hypothetical protein